MDRQIQTLPLPDGGSTVASSTGYFGYQSTASGTATVTGSGSTWNGGLFYLGVDGTGSLTVASGAVVQADAYLGFNTNSTGSATVTGPGSTWTGGLYVGFDGAASLHLTNGGTVNGYGYIGEDAGSTGTVAVDGSGSTWTHISQFVVADNGAGTLAITNDGKVVIDDFGSGLIGALSDSTGSVTVDGAGSTLAGGMLEVGSQGAGTLKIANGAIVSSFFAFIGNAPGSTGVVTVDGAGSTWNISTGELDVGIYGSGTMRIANAGVVISEFGYIGSGAATIDGPGSRWNITDELYVDPTSSLVITNGGKVTAATLTIDSASALLAMTVGDGSNLDLGPGILSNIGVIRLAAAPTATAGSIYTPITASAASTWGAVQALGGTWNSSAATFTVSAAATGNAGAAVTIDPSTTQRIHITDLGTGHSMIASFLSSPTPGSLVFTASPVDASDLALLQNDLSPGSSMVDGWLFTTSGYTSGDPVDLSFDIGSGLLQNDLALWHFDGTQWTPYSTDISYDGTFASFTVTGFSGYALTTTSIPEPASLAILVCGGMGLLVRRRKA
jgi:T5SS/PEP-CTERM-associated repeat protein